MIFATFSIFDSINTINLIQIVLFDKKNFFCFENGEKMFIVPVLTGSQSEATCKSRVQFIITGDGGESDIR